MGFRFRKTVRLGGLVRLNFSGSGVSLGLGPRGANVNISRRGVRKTLGLPGTGLSYQTFTKWPKSPPPSEPQPLQAKVGLPAPRHTDYEVQIDRVPERVGGEGTGFVKFLGALVLLVFLVSVLGLGKNTPSAPAATVAATASAPPAPAPATAPNTSEWVAAPAVSAATAAPQTSSPATTAPLTIDEVRELQTWLRAFGLDPGPVDGFIGPLTAAAIKKYEAARLQPVIGTADRPLLERLRRDTGGKVR